MTEDPRLGLPSASAFEIVAECPGQVQLLKKLPPEAKAEKEEEPDELRDRGTRVHRARETGNTLELSKEETELYYAGQRYETKLLEKWKETFALNDVEIVEGPRELRLWLHEPSRLEPVCSGQLDVHYICGTRAHIIDWKTGFLSNLVGARGNWQLRLQAILLKEDHPELTDIRVAFAKPLFEKSQLDFCDYTEVDLKYSSDSVFYTLWWTTQEDAPRRAGLHCRWCGCKAYCPEALAFSLLPVAIAARSNQKAFFRDKDVLDGVSKITERDLYRIWEAQSVIKKILEEVANRLRGMTEDELASIGLTHGKPRETINWTDLKGAFEFLKDQKKWDESALWSAMEFGLEKLSKLCVNETGIDEKYASDEVKGLLKAFYELKEGRPGIRKLK